MVSENVRYIRKYSMCFCVAHQSCRGNVKLLFSGNLASYVMPFMCMYKSVCTACKILGYLSFLVYAPWLNVYDFNILLFKSLAYMFGRAMAMLLGSVLSDNLQHSH